MKKLIICCTFISLSSCINPYHLKGIQGLSSAASNSDLASIVIAPIIGTIDKTGVAVSGICPIGATSVGVNIASGSSVLMSCLNNQYSGTLDFSAYSDGQMTVSVSTANGSVTSTVILDTTAPTTPTGVSNATTEISLTQSPIVTWTASTDSLSGLASYQARILRHSDNSVVADWTPLTSGSTLTGLALTDNTSYQVEVRALDYAGNVSATGQGPVWTTNIYANSIAAGTLDSTFSTTGTYTIADSQAYNDSQRIIIDQLGRVLMTGVIRPSPSDYGDVFLSRLLQNGTLDSTFNTTGTLTLNYTNWDKGVGLYSDATTGQITLAGAYTTLDDPFLLKLNADGSTNASFGTSGFTSYSISGENIARAMAVDPSDGSYYVVGDSGSGYGQYPWVVKFRSNGSIETAFATNGMYTTSTFQYGYALDVQVDQNGKVVVVGKVRPGGAGDDWAGIMWRFNANGTLDTTLNGAGYLLYDDVLAVNKDETISGLEINSNNDYFLTGFATAGTYTDLLVWKYNGSAGPVLTFGGANTGYARISNGNSTSSSGVRSRIDNLGNIVVAGSTFNGTNNDILVVRLTPQGIKDTTFGTSGRVTSGMLSNTAYNGNDNATDLAISHEGHIFVSGNSERGAGNKVACMIRIN